MGVDLIGLTEETFKFYDQGLSDAEKFKFHAQVWKRNCINWERDAQTCKTKLVKVENNFSDAMASGSILKDNYDEVSEENEILLGKVKSKNKWVFFETLGIVVLTVLLVK